MKNVSSFLQTKTAIAAWGVLFCVGCDRIPANPGSAPTPPPGATTATENKTSAPVTVATEQFALHVSGEWQGKWQDDYANVRVRWGAAIGDGGWLQRVFQNGELVTLGPIEPDQREFNDRVFQEGSYEYRLRAASSAGENSTELGAVLATTNWTLPPPTIVEKVFLENAEVTLPLDFQKLVLGKGTTLVVSVPAGMDFLGLREIHADHARIEIIDASPFSKRRPLRLRVETISGSLEIETVGRIGRDGANGQDGNRGSNGGNGSDATTREAHRWVEGGIPLSWNAYRYQQAYTECASAPTSGSAGGNGQDGEPGESAEDGGPALDLEIQIKEQGDARVSVSSTGGRGGKGGAGGRGGEAGIGGAAGKQDDGKICPAAANGPNGSPGRNGAPGRDGRTGPAGSVRWTRF
jgi:hypothetical protein